MKDIKFRWECAMNLYRKQEGLRIVENKRFIYIDPLLYSPLHLTDHIHAQPPTPLQRWYLPVWIKNNLLKWLSTHEYVFLTSFPECGSMFAKYSDLTGRVSTLSPNKVTFATGQVKKKRFYKGRTSLCKLKNVNSTRKFM